MSKTGLSDRDSATIIEIFKKYSDVALVTIFGSRAKGNYKKGSDIDLAIMNANVTPETITKLKGDFEESSLPYSVDLVNYANLNHIEMKEHIKRVGIVFYKK
jgi:predicted nucleotidyltransferase